MNQLKFLDLPESRNLAQNIKFISIIKFHPKNFIIIKDGLILMLSVYRKLFDLILWLIRVVTPSEGPKLNTIEKWRPHNTKPDQIDTTYGFPIDRWDKSIKILDIILSYIPIFDIEPDINPALSEDGLDKEYGDRVPSESADPDNLVDFLLNNTGSYFLELERDDVYVADFSDYEQYEVRPGLEKYGGKVFIKDGQITGYEYQNQKYPSDDQRLNKIIRATLCIKMMVEMHALRTHLCTAQRKTFEYYDKYNENHPLADFIYLSTYAVFDVNRRIPVLVGPHGLVVRLFALTQESYQQLVQNILAQSDFSRKEMLGNENTVWNKSIIEYIKLVDRFVSKLTKDEDERNDLANFFITSTALHNQFGDSQIYGMTISKFFLPKVYIQNPGFISKLDQDLLLSLLYAVTPRYPLIIDEKTSEVFSNPEHKEAWIEFQKGILEKYADNSWFDMRTAEISVGF